MAFGLFLSPYLRSVAKKDFIRRFHLLDEERDKMNSNNFNFSTNKEIKQRKN